VSALNAPQNLERPQNRAEPRCPRGRPGFLFLRVRPEGLVRKSAASCCVRGAAVSARCRSINLLVAIVTGPGARRWALRPVAGRRSGRSSSRSLLVLPLAGSSPESRSMACSDTSRSRGGALAGLHLRPRSPTPASWPPTGDLAVRSRPAGRTVARRPVLVEGCTTTHRKVTGLPPDVPKLSTGSALSGAHPPCRARTPPWPNRASHARRPGTWPGRRCAFAVAGSVTPSDGTCAATRCRPRGSGSRRWRARPWPHQ